jgi:hypothetical protein
MARYHEVQVCQECGEAAEKQLNAPAVLGDFPGYACPVTGRWIEGRRAHEQNLRETGCRILEPGERQDAARRRKASDAALENALAETAARTVAAMPPAKQEKLASELASGASVTVERRSLH